MTGSPDLQSHTGHSTSTALERVGDFITDALHYWEPMRIAYNLILAGIVAAAALHVGFPAEQWSFADTLNFLVLAVIANILYCCAYLADIPVQLSAYRARRASVRLVLFGVGSFLAGYFTWYVSTTALRSIAMS